MDIPIKQSPLLSEWFATGFDQGQYQAWRHGKHSSDSSCRCIETLRAAVERIEVEEDWKVFITRVGWLAGFAVGCDQEVGSSLGDTEPEGDSHA